MKPLDEITQLLDLADIAFKRGNTAAAVDLARITSAISLAHIACQLEHIATMLESDKTKQVPRPLYSTAKSVAPHRPVADRFIPTAATERPKPKGK
jgi:hypothetical protein